MQDPPLPGARNSLSWRMLFSPKKSLFLHQAHPQCLPWDIRLWERNSETVVLKNKSQGATGVKSESGFHNSACPTSRPFSTASTHHPSPSDEQFFRLAAQHIFRSTFSSNDNLGTLSNSSNAVELPASVLLSIHPPTPSILKILLLLFLVVFLGFSSETIQIKYKYEVLPFPADHQNQIRGIWLLDEHPRRSAATDSVPNLMGCIWMISRVWLLSLPGAGEALMLERYPAELGTTNP